MVVFCSGVSSTFADEHNVFGPKDFKLGQCYAHFSHHSFSIDDPVDGVIVVIKNTPEKKIWKGFLYFNRRFIPLRNFLDGDEIVFHKNRQLKSRNRLAVFLIGQPGASVRIAVKKSGSPVPPPQIAFSADPISIHGAEASVLTWTSTNADSVSIDQGIGPVDPDGSISVSPSETTTYTITATNRVGTGTADVTVAYLNTAPLAIPQNVETDEDSSAPIMLSGSDIDNDFLTYEIISGPSRGTLSGTPPDLTYTPHANNNGMDSFAFKVNDVKMDSSAATVTIQVNAVNDAPVTKDDTATTDENTPVTTANLLLNDTDIDGDGLSITGFTQPANGTVISHGDDTFTYTPDYGFNGTDRFTYTAGDGHGGVDTGTVMIEVVPGTLSLQITSPTPGQEFTTESITVTGMVNRAGASVFVNGIAATVSGNEYSADSVPLVPGINTIGVLAEDGDDTQVASISVMLMATLDLEPIQLAITSNIEDDGPAKVSGQATVTVANNGNSAAAAPYHIILFEDTNLNQSYDEGEDNRLGKAMVATGPGAGEATTISLDFAGTLLFRDNRMHVFVDSAGEVQELDEENNVTANRANGIDLSASLLKINEAACPDEVALTARIGNAGDSSISSGISVAFYVGEPGIGGSPLGTALTSQILEPGQYEDLTLQWSEPVAGITIIYAHADDYGTGVGTLSETDETNNLVSAEMAICTSLPATDGISGQVIDAQTGAILSGVTVNLHEEGNGIPGSVVGQADSDSYGGFAFSQIDSGTYFLIANLQAYIEGQRRVVFAPDETLTHQDVVLSPILNPGEFRIVLTWGENPADLEAHLTGPNPSGCREHCFYWNPTISGASLDVDDRQAYGPETITISQMDAGIYRFYVHDFTNRNSANSAALAGSGATVTVYSASGDAPLVYNVPAGAGNVWHVFNLDATSGAITQIDKLSHQSQPGEIDFPVINSYPVTRTTYGEPYTYHIKAEDPDLDDLAYSLMKGPEGMTLDPFSGLIQWNPAAGHGGVHRVEIKVTDGRCGEDSQVFDVIVDYLPVVQFSVEPRSGLNPGGEITLTWQTDRADMVIIDQGIGEVPARGIISLPSPEQPIPFTLTAVNNAGEARRTVPEKPTITGFSAPCVDSPGEVSLLSWSSEGAVSCAIDQGVGVVAPAGSVEITPWGLPANYWLACTNASGSTSQQIPISVCQREADISADVTCDWSLGDPVTLSWTTGGVDDCSILPGIGSVAANGSMKVSPDTDPSRYTLKCNGAVASFEIANPQSVDLAASTYRLLPGESTTLFWKTNCFDTCSIDQGIGDVTHSGSVRVTPDHLPTTYTLTAGNDRAAVTQFVTIGLYQPAVAFSASPALIKIGEPATLTWTTDRATSCTIQPDIGEVSVNGSLNVTPDHNTIYTLKAIGPGGTTYGTAAVTYVRPTATIQADREHLDTVGDAVTLTWVFSNADTCIIDQGIGQVQLGGSVVVYPQRTTTYAIRADGPGGTVMDSVTVAYTPPSAAIAADREILDEGETAVLTWNFSNADSCSIDQGIGVVQPGGSLVVDPDRTTTYTITAVGPGGRVTDSVTLTCLAPTVVVQTEPAIVVEGDSATLTWQADHAAACLIEPYLGQADLNGSISVSPFLTTTYTITVSGRGGTTSAQATVVVVNPPSIRVTEPDGNDDNAHTSYTIRWTDKDDDSDAVISLYYDINNSGADGTLIVGGIDENPDGLDDRYEWDTTNIPAGAYYVYALIDDGINDSMIDYSNGVVTIDHTVTDELKLTAADGAANDYFGSTVAISGDYAVVGAPGSGDAGAAYIFMKEGAAWVEQMRLIPGDGAVGDHFGEWVSISGNTVVVGAPGGDGGTGAAYVFTRDGSTWTQQARLIASGGQAWDDFGACLSISGDTLVVGAPNHNDYSGAAYVFTRQGSSWSESTKMDGGGAAAGGHFGASVSISEDALIVGSPSVGNQKGAAFIFRYVGSNWVAEAQLEPGDVAAWEYFGTSVSISGNYAIVGNTGLSEANVEGAARIYIYDGTAWVEQAKISAGSVNAGESFGRSVSINGNMTAVGEPKVWYDAGAVYLFQRTGSVWIEQDTSIPDEGESGDEVPHLPPGEGEGEGEGDPVAFSGYHKLIPSDGAAEDFFGDCVALDDYHVIVGARFDDDKGHESGSAYVYPLISVSIGADPESIFLSGEGAASTTLSWTSRGVDSVQIDPDIGTVAASGLVTISPRQTTTYTITGTKDGTTITDSVTVTIIDASVLPTVDISATPETIVRGESASLSWSSTNVSSVTLDNGIGQASMTGSLSVFPIETTTYTVTARNSGGTATAGVTISVADPLPTVELTVEPAEIMAGASAVLAWTAAHASTLVIEPGIGTVGANGTLAVAPMQTTVYTISASGSGGTAADSVTVTVANPITLQITSPLHGASVTGTTLSVKGTLSNSTGRETGLMVNGVIAMVSGNQFRADHVPLAQGENTITAMATDASGVTRTDSIVVDADTSGDHIRISADPVSGTPPFETTLRIDGTFAIASSQISYLGPYDVVFIDRTFDESRVQITTEGVYTFEVEVTDLQGNVYTDEVSVEVIDRVALDALLQAKWAGMKAALIDGDVDGALEYHHEDIRKRYSAIYNALGDDLPMLAQQMREISPIFFEDSRAKYRIRQDHYVEGQTVTVTYYVYFSRDENGIWRIEKY
jgi:hypothetical protein